MQTDRDRLHPDYSLDGQLGRQQRNCTSEVYMLNTWADTLIKGTRLDVDRCVSSRSDPDCSRQELRRYSSLSNLPVKKEEVS